MVTAVQPAPTPSPPLLLSQATLPVLDSSLSTEAIDLAQTSPIPGDLQPRRPDIKPLPDITPAPPPPPILPVPSPTPEPSLPETLPIPETITVQIQRIDVKGGSVFSEDELRQVTNRFIGQQANFEDLLAIRAAITDLYTSQGYSTSGAFLPPQDVTNGVVKVQVVEGELESIEIQGLHRLRPAYIRSRIRLAAHSPLNIPKLDQALQLLQLDPLLRSVQAELTPGTAPGRSILQLTLRETPPLSGSASIDNYDSPSTGSFGGTVAVGYNNILGLGDQFNGSYHLTEGVDTYNLSYLLPVDANNGGLRISYENSDSTIIEAPFDRLDINSDSETLSFGFRQPLIRSPTHEFALGASLDLRRSQTYLFDDQPFSFSEGPINGESKVTVLRLSQDWLSRSSTQVLAARSQFSIGLEAFDATINDIGADGRFFSWVGQFQWVQAFSKDAYPIISVVRLGTQLTPDSLLPLEQFSIGGIDTVRGYNQNQLVTDNGVIGSIEFRFPVVRDNRLIGNIQLVPFFDVGTGWNNQGGTPSPSTLLGIGLGLRWQLNRNIEARLDYGIPLIDDHQSGDSLQDSGLLFSLLVQSF